jgi:hypothetical protein
MESSATPDTQHGSALAEISPHSFRIQALQAVAAGAANDLGISHDFLRFREK